VFIGKKPTMNYVLAVVTQFNSGTNDVTIKARGRAISRAVDVAEIVRHRFMPGVNYRDIKIATDAIPTEGGGTANVSSIEIYLTNEAVSPASKEQ
jgi:archaea-specific DNA-binding protein